MKLNNLLDEFNATLGVAFQPDAEFVVKVENFLTALHQEQTVDKSERACLLITHANKKFDFNSAQIATFLAHAAEHGVTFNYHEKNVIRDAFNSGDERQLRVLLDASKKSGLSDAIKINLATHFQPIPKAETIKRLHSELKSPTLVRKDSKPRDWSQEILTSLFAAQAYSSFPERVVHKLNDPLTKAQHYESDFWLHLHANFPNLFSREPALIALKVSTRELEQQYSDLQRQVLESVRSAYQQLCNHGVFAILIDPEPSNAPGVHWQLFGDATLYAEKHIALGLKRYYFRPDLIAEATKQYIPTVDSNAAQFGVINFGFTYLDCFVMGDGSAQRLLLLYQKHQADETLIPCPRCRSHDVQGNSYSSFGVKSWECNNAICPDRSKFNRGKRYSFLQLLKQQAIDKPENEIPSASVRQWMRDVQSGQSDEKILELLLRHYSLANDTIWLDGWPNRPSRVLGRVIRDKSLPATNPKTEPNAIPPSEFFSSPLFARYAIGKPESKVDSGVVRKDINGCTALLGDAFDVLANLKKNSVDGAVTSPPYYNAREYSQWANIYTYLYDMYNINRQVFRVLKPGGIYLFNIFDYFDNENTISLSAMGDKRMILGPYVLDLFRRIGFGCVGNVVWDKGDIEGKRGFNNGNFSPYYQAPFNCWEHIFVLQKPGTAVNLDRPLPTLLKQKPVLKMVRGVNTHGHTAPFPEALPALLAERLPRGSVILDPFGGSMTTGLAAQAHKLKAICIEKDESYFNLGVQRLAETAIQPSLI